VPRLRQKARQRDGYRCTRCGGGGSPENPLEVHHIAQVAKFGEAANALELVITLCRACHAAEHGR
jgi:5-methylcytosine-specific restriction endonuclease McrA